MVPLSGVSRAAAKIARSLFPPVWWNQGGLLMPTINPTVVSVERAIPPAGQTSRVRLLYPYTSATSRPQTRNLNLNISFDIHAAKSQRFKRQYLDERFFFVSNIYSHISRSSESLVRTLSSLHRPYCASSMLFPLYTFFIISQRLG